MTRKKFVKQLMALGLSRNRANFHAMLCREKGIPYAQTYKAMEPWLQMAQNARLVKRAMGSLAAAFTHAAARLQALLCLPPIYKLDIPQIIEQCPAQQWPVKNPYLAHHGYVYGVDLAHGPDMTAYMPQGGGGHE